MCKYTIITSSPCPTEHPYGMSDMRAVYKAQMDAMTAHLGKGGASCLYMYSVPVCTCVCYRGAAEEV